MAAGLAGAAAVLLGVLIIVTRDDPTRTTPAATVNGVEISQRDVIAELDAIAGNAAYLQAKAQQSGTSVPIRGDDPTSYDSAFVADVLQRRILNELIRAEVARLGLHADGECQLAARDDVIANVIGRTAAEGKPVFDAFPPDYQNLLARRNLDELLLTAHLAGQECVSPDAARAYYEGHLSEFEEACLSIIQVATEAEANSTLSELRGGADFETLAGQRSTEPSSAQEGGSLGCKPKNQIPSAFLAAAFETPVGQVSDPVPTSGGFTLVRVDDRRQLSLDQVRQQASELAAVAATDAFHQWLRQALHSGTIVVDPRYGTWNEQTVSIDPPGATES